MIRWEPIPGQATGFAVFGRNGKRDIDRCVRCFVLRRKDF